MGWGNIVKGPRMDWEEDAQIKGSNHIVNNLYGSFSALGNGGKYYVPGKVTYAPQNQWHLPDRNHTGYYDP
jgi:hypothetical protein